MTIIFPFYLLKKGKLTLNYQERVYMFCKYFVLSQMFLIVHNFYFVEADLEMMIENILALTSRFEFTVFQFL